MSLTVQVTQIVTVTEPVTRPVLSQCVPATRAGWVMNARTRVYMVLLN